MVYHVPPHRPSPSILLLVLAMVLAAFVCVAILAGAGAVIVLPAVLAAVVSLFGTMTKP